MIFLDDRPRTKSVRHSIETTLSVASSKQLSQSHDSHGPDSDKRKARNSESPGRDDDEADMIFFDMPKAKIAKHKIEQGIQLGVLNQDLQFWK